MARNKIEVYLHVVWGTWDRHPLITSATERPLYRTMEQEANNQGCTIVACGGVEDHVHLLLTLPTTISIADLVKQLKGVSSHFVNDTLRLDSLFRWQAGYAAYSVSPRHTDAVKQYILNQKVHHQDNTLYPAYELPPFVPAHHP